MVFVTHDQIEAMTMGDRIAVMHGGGLEQIGTADEIFNSPATLSVVGFVGTPPMNLVPARDVVDSPDSHTGAWRNLIDRQSGTEVTLGVLPQHLLISAEPSGRLPVTVFALEHLGRESVLILDDQQHNKPRALVEPALKRDWAIGYSHPRIRNIGSSSTKPARRSRNLLPMEAEQMKPLRMGVIGVGFMGANHAKVWSQLPNTTLVAIADLNEAIGKITGDLRDELMHFAETIQSGAPFVQDYREAMSAVQVLGALFASIDQGWPVDVARA